MWENQKILLFDKFMNGFVEKIRKILNNHWIINNYIFGAIISNMYNVLRH